MNRLLLAAASLMLPSLASANTFSVHCPIGCPENPEGNHQVFTHIYGMSMSPETKFANWVAYEVTPQNFGVSPGRNWDHNEAIPSDIVMEEKDYSGSWKALGVDKGHMAPLAAFANNPYWYETNYISNITPQKSALNQGPWEELEAAIRKGATYESPFYVVTGSLFEKKMPALPKADESHKIPSGFYKLVYNAKGEGVAFIMEQDSGRSDNYCAKQVSISELSGRVGYVLPSVEVDAEMVKRVGC
ncbi:DNA/RNA non-specific endonuclease [Veronia pacifica]|uniref:DNA/RNA endonuclease n=1 Tax=Veronia pacifica TaxID=1080227 RepID=A0A1C3EL90_9GAMM|nr:DNA/RNA non-specific endonuclease [Veronia pacifica]ODA34001.1 DNA/RNA endonuclease [Veronia pacifica]